MSELNLPTVDELSLLKERANKLGIKYSPNIGIEALKEKINAITEPKKETAVSTGSEADERQRVIDEATKLIRCRIVNMNPAKRAWRGEIFTVANKYIGTIRKFVPFGAQTNEGYHIPKCIYDFMKNRKYTVYNEVKDASGKTHTETNLVNEFAIEVLPQLTEKELAELANAQKAAGSVEAK